MPGATVFGSNNLNIQPNLVRAPVDPLELAIKQAQLYNLQQEPDLRRQQLKLQQLGLQETQQHNVQDETLGYRGQDLTAKNQAGVLAEATRHNVQDESLGQGRLAEDVRYHDATVADANKQREAGLTQSFIAHLTSRPDIDINTLAQTFKNRGLPEFADALVTEKAKKVSDRIDQFREDAGALQKTGQGDKVPALVETLRKEMPNEWKYIKQHLPPDVNTGINSGPPSKLQPKGVVDLLELLASPPEYAARRLLK